MDFTLVSPDLVDPAQNTLPITIDVPQPTPTDPRKTVRHSVVFPPSFTIPPLNSPIFTLPQLETPPVTFPFKLDPFQEKSTAALSRGESVLVSAHTSAGKTAIAEYAIALCLQRGQKVAYTSPIKALSNQKFRDLSLVYDSVGLLTGDSTVNKTAQILVLTTEILRNMLQQGGELLRELGCVIFDEVHYMRNAERGVVWEDCISQLNSKMTFVFLSATIPNSTEFAGWVSTVHNKPIHVVYTEFRPVPLQFCICPISGSEVFHVFSSDDRILNNLNVQKARQNLPFQGGKQGAITGKNKQKMMNETILTCIKMLKNKQILPVIIFSFGKAKCEELAQLLSKQQETGSLLTSKQQETVELIFNAALKELDVNDQHLKQVIQSKQLLKNGIAVHHSGLLPFVKEITEILFQEELVKIIFVTETFAMGLNLPARCVVFTDLQKYDGQQNRYVQSGEFTQMAGRAGRRGLDTQGLVISFFSSQDDCSESLKIMQGGAESLNSSYRIGYSQLINYLRIEGFSAEKAIERSFLQFQRNYRLPRCQEQLEQIDIALLQFEKEFQDLKMDFTMAEVLEYLDLEQLKFCELNKLMLMQKEEKLSALLAKKLVRGRIVSVIGDNQNFGYGVVLSHNLIGGNLFYDVLIPAIAPKQYNVHKKSDEAAMTLNINVISDFEAVDEFVQTIIADNQYSSTVNKQVTMDSIITQSASALLGLTDEEINRVEFKCTEVALTASKINEIVQNDPFRFLLQRKDICCQNVMFDKSKFEAVIIRAPITTIASISTVYVKNLPISQVQPEDRKLILTKFVAVLSQLFDRFQPENTDYADKFIHKEQMIPKLNFDQLEGVELQYVEQQERVNKIDNLLYTNFSQIYKFFHQVNQQSIQELVPILLQIQKLKRRQNLLNNELSTGSKVLAQDLKNKKLLLQNLHYFDFATNQILEKGKIASKINAINELVTVECIFQNLFSTVSTPVFCGLLCGLLGERVKSQEAKLDPQMTAPIQKLYDIIDHLLDSCANCGVELEIGITRSDEVVDKNYAHGAYLWASGKEFQDILDEIPALFEGNVVRTLRRLVTGLEQVAEALAGWGDGELSGKCIEGIKLVNRGLVKADSLYIVEEEQKE